MKIKLLILFLVGQSLPHAMEVFGQGFCGTNGGFTINPPQGCAPLTIEIKNQVAKAENIRYAYNFDRKQSTFPDTKETSEDSSFVYTKPGTYTIFQYGSALGTGFSLCKDIVVSETRAPSASLISCPSGLARLTLIEDDISGAYDEIEINWGDGSITSWKKNTSVNMDHKYSAGSKPVVIISGKYASGMCQASLNTATITSATPPALTNIKISSVEMAADGKAKILYEGMDGIATEVFVDNGNGQFVTTGKKGSTGGAQSITIENLDPAKIYRFKVVSKDICDNPLESGIVGSMIIHENASALDETISLTWEQHVNTGKLIQYQLVRDDKVIFSTPDQLSYVDKEVTCGKSYKYEVVAIIENDVRSYSAPVTIQPKSTAPETIKKANVTVENNNLIISRVELSGKGLTSTYDLVVERAVSGSLDFKQISNDGNQSLKYNDQNVDASKFSYCYRFSYQNACKMSSPEFSEPVCSILLKNNTHEVFWTDKSPFTGSIARYELVQIDPQTKIIEEIPMQLDLRHEINLDAQASFSFSVKAYSADGNLLSYSNTIDLQRDPILLIPDAFTPNGDGINESFAVKSYFTTSFQMRIYNRWGEVVFEALDANLGWNGNIEGKPAPAGEYLFKITFSDQSQHSVAKTGSFLLIR